MKKLIIITAVFLVVVLQPYDSSLSDADIVLQGPGFVTTVGYLRYNLPYRVRATYYCPCEECNGAWQGMTATGQSLRYGIVAVDTRYWSFGQKFYLKELERDMVFEAQDVGALIKGKYRLDICLKKHSDTLRNLPRYPFVRVIKESEPNQDYKLSVTLLPNSL